MMYVIMIMVDMFISTYLLVVFAVLFPIHGQVNWWECSVYCCNEFEHWGSFRVVSLLHCEQVILRVDEIILWFEILDF